MLIEEDQRLNELKMNLFDTDYIAIKFAEGQITEEEYALIRAQRDAYRKEINKLNGQTKEDIDLEKKQKHVLEIKTRLNQLSEDIVQYEAGENVPNILARRAEFIQLHNELRQLEGKEPRKLK